MYPAWRDGRPFALEFIPLKGVGEWGWRELLGQVPRLVLAGPGSLLGRAPLGNTGGANVGIFTPMPIPEDLQALLRDS